MVAILFDLLIITIVVTSLYKDISFSIFFNPIINAKKKLQNTKKKLLSRLLVIEIVLLSRKVNQIKNIKLLFM